MEQGSVAGGLPSGSQSPNPSHDAHIWWHRQFGELHAKSCENIPMPHRMPTGQNRSFTSLTRSLSSSARTNASWFILSHTQNELDVLPRVCLYCGASGHFIRMCPSRSPRPSVSALQVEPDISTLLLLTVQLLASCLSVSVSALLDSGSSGNFISHALLTCLNFPGRRQAQELRIETIQENRLGVGVSSTGLHQCPSKWDVSIMRLFPFWYWRDPPWTSS